MSEYPNKPEDPERYDFLAKIVLIGDSGVGKSNLMLRYTTGAFNSSSKSTVGVEFATRLIPVENKILKAQIWDTAGQERYKSITNAYYRGAVGAFVVYDVTKRSSFEHAERWLNELRQYANTQVVVMLLGNKTDLLPKGSTPQAYVGKEEAKAYADKQQLLFLESSALDYSNVELAFQTLLTEVYNVFHKRSSSSAPNEKENNKNEVIEIESDSDSNDRSTRGGCCW